MVLNTHESADGHQRGAVQYICRAGRGGVGGVQARVAGRLGKGGQRLRCGQHEKGRGRVSTSERCAGGTQTAGRSGLGGAGSKGAAPRSGLCAWGCREDAAVPSRGWHGERTCHTPAPQHSGHFHCGCCSASFAVMPTHCSKGGGGGTGLAAKRAACVVLVRASTARPLCEDRAAVAAAQHAASRRGALGRNMSQGWEPGAAPTWPSNQRSQLSHWIQNSPELRDRVKRARYSLRWQSAIGTRKGMARMQAKSGH